MSKVVEQSSAITVEVIDTIDGFIGLYKDWNNLLRESNVDTIFYRQELLLTWWQHYGKDNELLVLVGKEGGKPIAIAPLMIEKTKINCFGVRAVKFIGGDEYSKADIIVEKGKEDIVEKLFEHLLKLKHKWDCIWLKNVEQQTHLLETLQRKSKEHNISFWRRIYSVSPYFKLPNNWDDFWSSLKLSTKKKLKRRQKRIEELGDLQFISIKTIDEFDKHLKDIIAIDQKSWKGKDDKGIFVNQENLSFHKALAKTLAEMGWLNLSLLKLDDKYIAYQHGFEYNNVFYAYNSSYDPDYHVNSPGNITILRLCEQLIKEGRSEFDLLCGDQQYKFDWTNDVRRYDQIMLFKSGVYGSILYVFQSKIKPIIRDIVNSIKGLKGKKAR